MTEELVALKELYARSGGRPTVLERKSLMARFGLSKEKVFGWFQKQHIFTMSLRNETHI
jgi:hypothetical protein